MNTSVEPVDPFRRGDLDLPDASRRGPSFDYFGLVKAVGRESVRYVEVRTVRPGGLVISHYQAKLAVFAYLEVSPAPAVDIPPSARSPRYLRDQSSQRSLYCLSMAAATRSLRNPVNSTLAEFAESRGGLARAFKQFERQTLKALVHALPALADGVTGEAERLRLRW